MATAFRSKTLAGGANGTSVAPTEPAGAAANDILFWWQVLATGYSSYVAPSLWTLLFNLPGTAADVRLYWIRRGGSAPNLSASWTTSVYVEASVTCWSGCETSGNPYDQAQNNTRTSRNPCAPDCPQITSTVINTTVIAFGMGWGGWLNAGGWTAPTGYTIRESTSTITGGDLCVASKDLAAITSENPAAFGNGTSTNNEVAEITVNLKPPAAASTQQQLMLTGCGSRSLRTPRNNEYLSRRSRRRRAMYQPFADNRAFDGVMNRSRGLILPTR